MVWVRTAVHDFLLSDPAQIQKSVLTIRNFSGQGCAGNRGTADLLLFKYGLGVLCIQDYTEGTSLETRGTRWSSGHIS